MTSPAQALGAVYTNPDEIQALVEATRHFETVDRRFCRADVCRTTKGQMRAHFLYSSCGISRFVAQCNPWGAV